MELTYLPLAELQPNPENPKDHDQGAIAESIATHGYVTPLVRDERTGYLLAGHGRLATLQHLAARGEQPPAGITRDEAGAWHVPVVTGYATVSDQQARRYLIADNRTTELGGWDEQQLAELLADLAQTDEGLAGTGYDGDDLDGLLAELGDPGDTAPGEGPTGAQLGTLAARFGAPPFSVLDARQGYWRARKQAWLSLGIRSELGRGDDLLSMDGAIERREGIRHSAEGYSVPAPMAGHGGMGQQMMAGKKGQAAASYKGQDSLDRLMAQKRTAAQGLAQHFAEDGTLEWVPTTGGGVSIFDPVLCELVYRWWLPDTGGVVLDPFAGGSVRGVVAGWLGHQYHGIDLRAEQVEANRAQATQLWGEPAAGALPDHTPELTEVHQAGDTGVLVKRDDTYRVAGQAGGKVRSCAALIAAAAAAGAEGVTTAGSRHSPQVQIVAHLAARYGLQARCHVPAGDDTPQLLAAQQAGAELVRHRPGHNSVIVSRARKDAEARGWVDVPFGMECPEAIEQTAAQVNATQLADAQRLVVPVGSGMTLAGVLHGLQAAGLDDLPVVGVRVGADPAKRLDRWAPDGWADRVQLITSEQPYEQHAPVTELGGIELDPIYEAKCLPHLQPGDLLWLVGHRQPGGTSPQPAPEVGAARGPTPTWYAGDSAEVLADPPAGLPDQVDLVFTCPPYADLEVYSEHPADLSAQPWAEARQQYQAILALAAERLAPDRFMVVVIGEARDATGAYYGLVPDTIEAARAAGLAYHGEAVLVTAVGSLAVRAGRAFNGGRKLGKSHQNVLIFYRGDPRHVTRHFGPVVTPDDLAGEVDPSELEGADLAAEAEGNTDG